MLLRTAVLLSAAVFALPALGRSVPPNMEAAWQMIRAASPAFPDFFAKRFPAAYPFDKTCGRLAGKDIEYCMRPAYARLEKSGETPRRLTVLFAGEVVDAKNRTFPRSDVSVPGVIEYFVFDSADGKKWTISQSTSPVLLGTRGVAPGQWRAMQIGPRVTGIASEAEVAGRDKERFLFLVYSADKQVYLSRIPVYLNRGQGTQRGCLRLRKADQDACLRRVHEVVAELRPQDKAQPVAGFWPMRGTVTHLVKDKRWKPEEFVLAYSAKDRRWVWPRNAGFK